MASMQAGGSSADCWVITQGKVDATSLLQSAPPRWRWHRPNAPSPAELLKTCSGWAAHRARRKQHPSGPDHPAQPAWRGTDHPRPVRLDVAPGGTALAGGHARAAAPLPALSAQPAAHGHGGKHTRSSSPPTATSQVRRVFERSLIAALGDARAAAAWVSTSKFCARPQPTCARAPVARAAQPIERAETGISTTAAMSMPTPKPPPGGPQRPWRPPANGWPASPSPDRPHGARQRLAAAEHRPPIERLTTLAQAMRQAFDRAAHEHAVLKPWWPCSTAPSPSMPSTSSAATPWPCWTCCCSTATTPLAGLGADTLRSRLRKTGAGRPCLCPNPVCQPARPRQLGTGQPEPPWHRWPVHPLRTLLQACTTSAMGLSDALSQRHFSHADQGNRSLLA